MNNQSEQPKDTHNTVMIPDENEPELAADSIRR